MTNAGGSILVANVGDPVPVTNPGNSATGVDACAGGWVAVTFGPPAAGEPSASPTAAVALTATVAVAPTLDGLPLSGVVGIDMPLGLLEDGWRVADVLARLYEVHPELAFAALAGAPLAASKHTEAGLVIRRELLAQAGLTLPPKVPRVPENDLLDAAAVAWSARRIGAAKAVTLTDPAQHADDGTEIAIRY